MNNVNESIDEYNSGKSVKYLLYLMIWLQIWSLIKINKGDHRIIYSRKKTKHFASFHCTVLFYYSKKMSD